MDRGSTRRNTQNTGEREQNGDHRNVGKSYEEDGPGTVPTTTVQNQRNVRAQIPCGQGQTCSKSHRNRGNVKSVT